MARKCKCQICGITDTPKDEMIAVAFGVKTKVNKYYHKSCYPKFLEEKAFKEREEEELNELLDAIMEVHQVKEIPEQIYPYLHDLRNGTIKKGGRTLKKKKKEGYDFLLIRDTYLQYRKAIEWSKKNIDFNGMFNEFKYAWTIINDKIHLVEKRRDKLRKQKALEERVIIEQNEKEETVNVVEVDFTKKKKKDDMDISDFL